MPNKLSPEIRVLAEPRANIPRRRVDAFIVADIIADTLAPLAASAGIYVRGDTPGWRDWQGLSNGLKLVNVGFARFKRDGTVGRVPVWGDDGRAGFHILPQAKSLDSKIDGKTIASGRPNLEWSSSQGTFATLPSLSPTRGNAIYNTGSETTFSAATTSKLARNQSLRFDLRTVTLFRGGATPEVRIRFGADYSIAMRHDMAATIEQSSLDENGNEGWVPRVTMDGAGLCDMAGGHFPISIMHLDGRMVVDFRGYSYWLYDPSGLDSDGNASPQEVAWEASPLVVTGSNIRARLETSLLDYTGQSGQVIRRVVRPVNDDQNTAGAVPMAGGWQKEGTTMPISLTTDESGLQYTVDMSPSSNGVHTPFLGQVMLSYKAVWTTPSAAAVDITAAVTRCTLNLAHPPVQAGAEGSLELSRKIAALQCPGWENVTQDYCPISVQARWVNSDGSRDDWRGLFRGHLFGQSRSSGAVNDHNATFTLRDPIVRLQSPAGIVTQYFAPLDELFVRNAIAAHGVANPGFGQNGLQPATPTALYGGQCVQEILRQALGPDIAGSLNGDGNSQRFFDANWPPLLDWHDIAGSYLPLAAGLGQELTSGSLSKTSQGNLLFPAPFKEDALSWINKFAADEFAVFFFGYIDRSQSGSWPVPIYGRYLNYLDAAKLWYLPDAVLSAVDRNFLIGNAVTETRPAQDINNIIVSATTEGYSNPYSPALRIAEARLGADDDGADVYSWKRTKWIENNLGVLPGGVETVAAVALAEVAGLRKQWPRITMPRGEAQIQVGDVIVPRLDAPLSDPSLNLDGRTFRAASVEHEWNFAGDSTATWTTTLGLRPMSRTEEIRFRRVNSLPIPSEWVGF